MRLRPGFERMRGRLFLRRLILVSFPLLLFCGCEMQDGAAFTLDLSDFNWQTGALIALAYLANSRGQLAGVAKAARQILRQLRILPAADDKKSATADQIAELLADVFLRLQGQPELQKQVLSMMGTCAECSEETGAADAGK
jgi:hypothetical protein